MLIRELMVQPPAVVHQDTPLAEVAQVMLARHLACVAVVDDRGELCGVITEEDFVPEDRLVPFSTERLPKLFGEWMPRWDVEKVYKAARGLKAKDILTEAKLLSVCDIFDAMTTKRTYKDEVSVEKALEELRGNAGLDQGLVEKFAKVIRKPGFLDSLEDDSHVFVYDDRRAFYRQKAGRDKN